MYCIYSKLIHIYKEHALLNTCICNQNIYYAILCKQVHNNMQNNITIFINKIIIMLISRMCDR